MGGGFCARTADVSTSATSTSILIFCIATCLSGDRLILSPAMCQARPCGRPGVFAFGPLNVYREGFVLTKARPAHTICSLDKRVEQGTYRMARFAYVWGLVSRFVTATDPVTKRRRDLAIGVFCVAVVILTLRQWIVPLAPPRHLFIGVAAAALFGIFIQPLWAFLVSHGDYKPRAALRRIRDITARIGEPRYASLILAASLTSLYFVPAPAGTAWSVQSIDNVCEPDKYQIVRWSKEDDFFNYDMVVGHLRDERRIPKGCADDHPFLTHPGYFRVSLYAGAGSIAIGIGNWKVGYPINTLDIVVSDDFLGNNVWHFADVAHSSHFKKTAARSIKGWELADTISFSGAGARSGEVMFTLGSSTPSMPSANTATIHVFINDVEVFRNERPLIDTPTM